MNDQTNLNFFIYCRKSSEDDRQAASIGDQLRELNTVVGRENLHVVEEPFAEERSAKAPGRPVFTEMLERVEDGEANALLCWDIDRLYRNPVDEGRVRWLLQHGVIRQIRTPFRTYLPQDAGLLMGVEGGRATDHIITLRKGVLRGFRGKLDKGHRPGPAPPGYLNNTDREKGERNVIPDPERFDLIRRAWDLMLTGEYSVRRIQRVAKHKWGLRSRKTKKLGGKPLSISAWYRIFTEPFYYGYFWWKEPGTNTRRLYRGSHEPMVTEEEFNRVQMVLGRKGKRSPKRRRFAFTRLIQCGHCGATVTAEAKYQVICSRCKTKFSALNQDACPKCRILIEDMEDPTRLFYTYYHCTKRKDPSCPGRSVRIEELERQMRLALGAVTLPHWAVDLVLEEISRQELRDEEAAVSARDSLQKQREDLRQRLRHLNELILSPDTDWDMISPDEVKAKKTELLEELQAVEDLLAGPATSYQDDIDLTREIFRFASAAAFWFREGDMDQKRAILTTLGSNLTLKDRELALEVNRPFTHLIGVREKLPTRSSPFEPDENSSTNAKTPPSLAEFPCLRRAENAIRTYWKRS